MIGSLSETVILDSLRKNIFVLLFKENIWKPGYSLVLLFPTGRKIPAFKEF